MMKLARVLLAAMVGGMVGLGAVTAQAQNVKITPIGSHDGEFCRLDRAMVFEDPDGTRVLYGVGRTVAGAGDARLGNIDAVLVRHVHGDHLGDRHIPAANAGECGSPDFSVGAVPNSNSVNIVVAKKAKFIVGSELASFFPARSRMPAATPSRLNGSAMAFLAKSAGSPSRPCQRYIQTA